MRLLPLLFLLACPTGKDSAADSADEIGDTVDPYACASGSTWTGGDEESPLMNPGEDCIACHAREREGPRFVVAGTVFTNSHEPDDCNGVQGVTITLTDADGETVELTSNAAGNFYASDRELQLAFPITAAVTDATGSVRAMSTEVESGSCNECHTQEGTSDAPGRVMAP